MTKTNYNKPKTFRLSAEVIEELEKRNKRGIAWDLYFRGLFGELDKLKKLIKNL